MKECLTCKEIKSLKGFYKDFKNKSGLTSKCSSCIKKANNQYYINNTDKIKEKVKIWAKNNPDKIKTNKKLYYENVIDKDKEKERLRKFRLDNPEKVKASQKKYELNNRDKINENSRMYRLNNPEKRKASQKKYREDNRGKINDYYKNRKKNNLDYRILCNLRSRLWFALSNNSKSKHTLELIGCSIEKLKKHLQNEFTRKMNWENYGAYWEIDHILPCIYFDLTNENQQKKCFHYTNLQPLTCYENRKKGSKINLKPHTL